MYITRMVSTIVAIAYGLLNMFFLVILHFDKRRILTWRESIQHDREKQSLETETTNDKT